MAPCFFVSDLHGKPERYRVLFQRILDETPRAVFLGGDLFPHELARTKGVPGGVPGFLDGVLAPGFERVRNLLGDRAPRVFVILGNDDARFHEAALRAHAANGLWSYVHQRCVEFDGWLVCGYATIPPSPFQNKDFERYDVSRYVDPGCVPPDQGTLSVPVSERELVWTTIAEELASLAKGREMERALCLFHAPPHGTAIDRAALDDVVVDHAPVDVHVGSVAVRRFFETHAPRMGLHGHVHEAARLTGRWHDLVGTTPVMTAAHDGSELALVRFDPDHPESATRELVPTG